MVWGEGGGDHTARRRHWSSVSKRNRYLNDIKFLLDLCALGVQSKSHDFKIFKHII